MNKPRGIMMLLAAGVAVWKGLHIHRGHGALLAFSLAALALGMAIWHLTRRDPPRRAQRSERTAADGDSLQPHPGKKS